MTCHAGGRPVGAANYPILMVPNCFLLKYSGPSKEGGLIMDHNGGTLEERWRAVGGITALWEYRRDRRSGVILEDSLYWGIIGGILALGEYCGNSRFGAILEESFSWGDIGGILAVEEYWARTHRIGGRLRNIGEILA
jgi:hypothetical protein